MRQMVRSIDPIEVQSRFAAVEPLAFEEYEEDRLDLDDLEPFLQKLPAREIDLIEMYYRLRKKQKEIAEFFSVSQGAISHRLSRAKKRLKFLRDKPKVDGNIYEDLKDHFSYRDIEIMDLMEKTTCQSETAKIINEKYGLSGKDMMTQVKCRHRHLRAIAKLEKEGESNPKLKEYYTLCAFINEHLYLSHEVILPHFFRGTHVFYTPKVAIPKKKVSAFDKLIDMFF